MKILFVGCSSFTGYHFVKILSKNRRNEIFCTLTKKKNSYNSIRGLRINLLNKINNIKLIEGVKFGDKKFLKTLKKSDFKIICLHHAETSNYNDDKKFNFKNSIKKNTFNIDKVFKLLKKNTKIIISNTIFQDISSKNYSAVNKYGKSKSIAYEQIMKACSKYKLNYKSLFITNPWGPYEEKKLNYYLMNSWLNNNDVTIKYPKYIRDNIHIHKLSKNFKSIVYSNSKKKEYFPSGYCTSNEIFVKALKKKFERYFKTKVSLKFTYGLKHIQPLVRVNGRVIKNKIIFKEELDEYFDYYKKLINKF